MFVLSWLAAGACQGSRYSTVRHTISDMYAVTAPYGKFLVVVLTVCGAGTILFALTALRPAPGGGWRATTGTVLLALSIYGVGNLLTIFRWREGCRLADQGCMSADQVSAGGATDVVLSIVGLLCVVPAGVLHRRRHEAGPELAEVGLADAMVFLLATGFLGGLGIEGLLERVLAAAGAAGIAALADRRPATQPRGSLSDLVSTTLGGWLVV